MKQWISPSKAYRITQLPLLLSHVYLVAGPEGSFLVDSGTDVERNLLDHALKERDVLRLEAVILTHAHVDHAGNAAWLAARYGCPVYAAPEGLQALSMGVSEVPEGRTIPGKAISKVMHRTALIYDTARHFEPCSKARDIRIWQPPEGLEVVLTPGHSPDGLCLLVEDWACLSGDLLIRRGRRLSQTLADDEEQWRLSIQKLVERGPFLWLTGHGRNFKL